MRPKTEFVFDASAWIYSSAAPPTIDPSQWPAVNVSLSLPYRKLYFACVIERSIPSALILKLDWRVQFLYQNSVELEYVFSYFDPPEQIDAGAAIDKTLRGQCLKFQPVAQATSDGMACDSLRMIIPAAQYAAGTAPLQYSKARSVVVAPISANCVADRVVVKLENQNIADLNSPSGFRCAIAVKSSNLS